MAFDSSTLNLSRYRTMSSLTLGGSITTGKNLITLLPKVLPEDEATAIKKAANQLSIAVDEAEQVLADRFDNKADLRLERLFDLLVDKVWIGLRSNLEFWSCYDHEGVDHTGMRITNNRSHDTGMDPGAWDFHIQAI